MSTTTSSPTSTRHAGVDRTGVVGLGPVTRPSFARLTRVELRKSVDHRAGRWLLALLLLLSLAGLTWEVATLGGSPTVPFSMLLGTAMTGSALLLPVLGVLAMTSEWTQRTALTTFTLAPRRVRVLLAKVAAALLLTAVVVVTAIALSALATLLGGLITGKPIEWDRSLAALLLLLAIHGLNVLMGAGFGALLSLTGPAIAAVFIAPITMSLLAETVLKQVAPWFDVFAAFSRIELRDFDGMVPQTLTSIGVWVLLPLAVGIWLSSRREVK